MSTRTARIPRTARVVAHASATIPVGPNTGKAYEATVHAGESSQGYKSGYDRIPHRWLTIRVAGRAIGCWQYSGARIARADRDYRASVVELTRAGAIVQEA